MGANENCKETCSKRPTNTGKRPMNTGKRPMDTGKGPMKTATRPKWLQTRTVKRPAHRDQYTETQLTHLATRSEM